MESTKDVSGNWSSGGETALTGLTPSTNYSISVAGVNQQGDVGGLQSAYHCEDTAR